MARNSSKGKKSKTNPPLDWFGQGPTFYIDGEDEFYTCLGFLLTIVLFLILLGAFIFYFLQYLNGDEMQASLTETALGEYPEMDLGDKHFFISLDFWYKRKKLSFSEVERNWIDITVYQVIVTKAEDENSQGQISRTELAITDCSSSEIDTGKYTGKADEIIKDTKSKCVKFKSGSKLSGSARETWWKFIEIRIEPCKNDEKMCKTSNIPPGATIHTSPKLNEAYEYFKGFYIQLSFVDSKAQADDFDDPIKPTLTEANTLSINLFSEKYRDYYFKQFTVESEYGWFWKVSDEKSGISLDKEFFETVYRDPSVTQKFFSPGGEVDKLSDYYTVRFIGTNINSNLKREYELLVDVFSNVGGIAEVASFIILLFVMIHRDVCLERNLLNSGLLQTDITGERVAVQEIYDPRTGGYVRRNYRVKYTYCEIFRFKYFSCCGLKNSSRYGKYERDMGIIQERLDVKRIINSNGQLEILGSTVFEDYQVKLIPYLKPEMNKQRERISEMTNEEAFSLLQNEEIQKTEEQVRIDNYIRENLDGDFYNEYKKRGHIREAGRRFNDVVDEGPGSEMKAMRVDEFSNISYNEGNYQNQAPVSIFGEFNEARPRMYLNRYSGSLRSVSDMMPNEMNSGIGNVSEAAMEQTGPFRTGNNNFYSGSGGNQNIANNTFYPSFPVLGATHSQEEVPEVNYDSMNSDRVKKSRYSNKEIIENLEKSGHEENEYESENG